MFAPTGTIKQRKRINLEQTKWLKGYISALAESRIPNDGLADMTNMTIEQDGLPRPRPSLVTYGQPLLGASIGQGTFSKTVIGTMSVQEKWEISMQIISGIGKIHIRKDGGAWTAIADVDNTYDSTAWSTFTQSNSRVYVSNGVNYMSFYDIVNGTIEKYVALATPTAPTATQTGLTGTNYTYRYRITANNNVGETNASVAGTVSVSSLRNAWTGGTTQYVDVSWSAVTGATSYNVYVGTVAGQEKLLTTVTGTTFRDDNRIPLTDFSKIAPPGNATAGPILKNLINSNGQLFGVGDRDNPSYLWYSGSGQNSGDFSPFNGGGFVAIDYGGENVPVAVKAFRTGKGDPAATILSKGSAGKGKLHHVVFQTTQYGDYPITYPQVIEANGQSGTVSPMAVIEANNSLHYPTGTDFKSTGTKANIVGILTTDSTAQAIDQDIRNLTLSAMDKAVGLEFENRLIYALPHGSDYNNEIWIQDLSRSGLWILRWTVAAKYMWLYEDNSGITHFCVLTYDNQIGEFTRSVATQDFGVAFRTRCASGGLTWDDTGMSMGAIQDLRLKFLHPVGSIKVNVYGIGQDGPTTTLGNGTYQQSVSFTGWGQYIWSYSDEQHVWSEDPGAVNFTSQAIGVVKTKVNKTLNQLTYEVITEEPNCDYFLSSSLTTGKLIDRFYYGD